MKNKIIVSLLFLCLVFSCKKEDLTFEPNVAIEENIENEEIDVISNFEDNFGGQIQANFLGTILNQKKEPVSEAKVSLGNLSTITDANGIFSFKEATVFEKHAFIRVEKEGYINGSRVLVPNATGINALKIIVLEKVTTAIIDSGENSEVTLTNGTKVSLQGNYITENGDPYSGKVEVSLHYLAPSNVDTYSEMPGSLLGSSENNDAVLLQSYGMVAVNLFAPGGALLNIDPETPATIELPIDTSQLSFAPQTIPLWYFDETLGYWKKEGSATKVNGMYVGEVSHFSFWNCDDFVDFVNLCVNIKSNKNKAVTNTTVILERQTNNFTAGSGITNDTGDVCGIIPANETITLKTYFTNCNNDQLVYEEQIGPFTIDAEIDVILNIAEFEDINIVASAVNCQSNEPITNGYALLLNGTKSKVIPVVEGAIAIDMMYCLEELDASVVLYDLDDKTESQVVEFTFAGNEMNLGEINTCETVDNNEDEKIYTGNVVLNTQEEVDDFGNQGYTKIRGNLVINDASAPITNLGLLEKLVVVEGDLEIKYNVSLANLFGLQNLERVEGSLILRENPELNQISSLQSLQVIGESFAFFGNHKVISLDGLQNIAIINNDLEIVDNDALVSLEGLNNLAQVLGNFHLGSGITQATVTAENRSLNDIAALEKLTNVGKDLRLIGQPALLDYSGLTNLITVGERLTITFEGETNLIVDGFANLKSVGGQLHIYANNVTEISGFNNLENVEELSVNGSLSPLKTISGFNSLISGSVAISLMQNLESIEGFQSLVNSKGISISRNPLLKNINGFNNLETVSESFSIQGNPLLENASGFSLLREVGVFFSLNDNDSMTNLNDFSSLEVLLGGGSLSIKQMDGLVDLTGLSSLTALHEGRLEISDNRNLTSLNGLNNLVSVGNYVLIDNCDSLINLDGLQGLTSIGSFSENSSGSARVRAYLEIIDNDNLVSLEGLNNLNSVGRDVRIGVSWNISSLVRRSNPKLSDFCALINLFENDNTNSVVEIENNAHNPSKYAILNGSCKL